MNTQKTTSTILPTDTPEQSPKPDLDPIGQNIENILAFYSREEQSVTRSQRVLETIINSIGQPIYISVIVIFCALWILANVWLDHSGFATFDSSPFHWLQGIIGLAALLIMIVILIKQNRHDKIEERRAHLELQVNLLTEQKTTKLINLLEELRSDLPMINDRDDPEVTALQQRTDPEAVLAALDEHLETEARKTD